MKTIAKIIIAVSILTLSFQANAAEENLSRGIIYKVAVHLQNVLPASPGQLFVVVLDEKGQFVAPPQWFNKGISEYTFRETGPVKGTRTARLSYEPGPHPYTPACKPDIKSGLFLNGNTYYFNLYVFPPLPDPTTGIE
jgi:hypothetical protein